MENYRRNRTCACMRCKLGDMMGPVMLITIGTLFLIDRWYLFDLRFGQLWPVILIAIGSVHILQASASTVGHRQPWETQAPPMPPPPPAGTSEVQNG